MEAEHKRKDAEIEALEEKQAKLEEDWRRQQEEVNQKNKKQQNEWQTKRKEVQDALQEKMKEMKELYEKTKERLEERVEELIKKLKEQAAKDQNQSASSWQGEAGEGCFGGLCEVLVRDKGSIKMRDLETGDVVATGQGWMSPWCAEMSSEQIHDYAKFLVMFFFSGGHVAKSRRSELLTWHAT